MAVAALLRGTLFICCAAVTAVTGVRVAPTTATVATVAPRRHVLAGLAAAAALESGGAAAAEQKTYLITGASSGIGFAAASELARRGHRVALAGRTVESAAATAARFPGAALWTPQRPAAPSTTSAPSPPSRTRSDVGPPGRALLAAGVDGAHAPPTAPTRISGSTARRRWRGACSRSCARAAGAS